MYTKVNWQNGEAGGTPLSAANLNHMDEGIYAAEQKASQSASAVETIQQDVTEIQEAIGEIASDISTIQSDITTIQGDVVELQEGKADKTEITRLEKKIENRISANVVDTEFNLPTVEGGIKLNKLVGKSYKSKNICNLLDATVRSQSPITMDISENSVKMSYTTTSSTWLALRLGFPYITNGSFTISCKITSNDDFLGNLGVYAIKGNTATAKRTLTKNETSYTVTLGADEILGIYFHYTTDAGTTSPRILEYNDIQITQGSTVLPYEPYGLFNSGDSGEIVVEEHNDNLLIPTLQTTTINGVTCTNNGDGTYTLNGTASANAEFKILNITENLFANCKMVGCPINVSSLAYLAYQTRNESGAFIEKVNDIGNGAIVKSSAKIDVIITVLSGKTVSNLVFKPMLTTNLSATYDSFVKAETTPTIIPLSEPLYEQNVIDVEKGIIEKKYKKVTVSVGKTGSYKATNNYLACLADDAIPVDNAIVVPYVIFNNKTDEYKSGNRQYIETESSISICVNNVGRIFMAVKDITTQAQMDNWLAVHPITIIYPLATPTTEPLTDEQIEALNSLVSFKGRTLIDTADVYAKATLDLDYPVDIIGYINDLLAPQTASVMSLSEPIEVDNEEES